METLAMRPAKPDACAQPDRVRETREAVLDPRHASLELGRRNGIEPVLDPIRTDDLIERHRLSGPEGDAVSAILCATLCAIGHNCRLLLAWCRGPLARPPQGTLGIVTEGLPAAATIIKPSHLRTSINSVCAVALNVRRRFPGDWGAAECWR
ncbi:MAG: hypothetical protein AAGC57_17980 [Pseudomonadota bacterium]